MATEKSNVGALPNEGSKLVGELPDEEFMIVGALPDEESELVDSPLAFKKSSLEDSQLTFK